MASCSTQLAPAAVWLLPLTIVTAFALSATNGRVRNVLVGASLADDLHLPRHRSSSIAFTSVTTATLVK